ncbi:hypothetical protein MLD38_040272 [Melastoma candidum]|uniref:Uncharacterized protein n=1 Tax=Melastoma candidum TaxID=119954 RepID=A0ACB9L5N0_9MYRT|nr:hypothetical protein MLD38_040272 [Melastoma candidum]
MEESGEVHSADDKGPSERTKRRLRTPQQLAGLEEFYNEHKYPTKEMRLQLAEQLGLTEKQISGWFFQRRLKEKKLLRDESNAEGRQDRLIGVNRDDASGLRQDSCGSTKQTDRMFEPREVESRRLYRPNSSPAYLTYDLKGPYAENFAAQEDTSSGSNSASQDRFCAQGVEHYGSGSFVGKNEVFDPIPSNGKRTMHVRYKPSGYLKRKGGVEIPAITAVKRRLGRHYRDDGPVLGIEFNPLPPGAFKPPIDDPDLGSHYAKDPTPTSSHGYGISKLHNMDSGLASYNSKVDYHKSSEVEGNFCEEQCFSHYDGQAPNPLNKRHVASKFGGQFGGRKSSDVQEYHNGDAYAYNSGREGRFMITGHPAEEMRPKYASDCLPPRSVKSSRKRDCHVHEYDPVNNGFEPNGKMMPKHVTHHRNESLHPEDEGPSRKILKKEKRHHDTELSEYLDHDTENMHGMSELPAATRFRAKLPQQEGTSVSLHLRKYQTTESALGMPSYMEEAEEDEELNSSE